MLHGVLMTFLMRSIKSLGQLKRFSELLGKSKTLSLRCSGSAGIKMIGKFFNSSSILFARPFIVADHCSSSVLLGMLETLSSRCSRSAGSKMISKFINSPSISFARPFVIADRCSSRAFAFASAVQAACDVDVDAVSHGFGVSGVDGGRIL